MNHNIITQKRKGIMLRFFAGRKMRFISMTVLMSMLFQLGYPTAAWALTGGPSQPEVESFEPVGTSEMVDLFSGDFNYNIPLLDVDGYPINIAYHSGVTTDQEASWVGLGWNINAGVVNRNMRGLPDDFNGEEIRKDFNIKENRTWGVTGGYAAGIEVLGVDKKKVIEKDGGKFNIGGSISLGIQFNNYKGYSANFSITPSIGPGQLAKCGLTSSLGINANSDEGASIQPNVGFAFKVSYADGTKRDSDATSSTLGISFGGGFNSRSGLKSLSISGNIKFTRNHGKKSTSNSLNSNSTWTYSMPSYTPSSELDFVNHGFSGKFSVGYASGGLYQAGFLQGFTANNHLRENSKSSRAYGYLNSHESTSVDAIHDFNRENESAFNESTPSLALAVPTYDIFSVSGQGVGGNYRPFRSDIGSVYDPKLNGSPSQNYNLEVELGFGVGAHVGGAIGVSSASSNHEVWENENSARSQFYHRESYGDNLLYEPYYFKEASEKTIDEDISLITDNGGYGPVRLALDDRGRYDVHLSNKWLNQDEQVQSVTNTRRQKRQKRTQLFTIQTNDEAEHFGVQRKDTYEDGRGNLIGEICNVSADGSRYIYGLPVYNHEQFEVSFAVGTSYNEDVEPNVSQYDPSTGIVQYQSGQNSIGNTRGIDHFFSSTRLPEYAHSFMLTCILSSDYVDSENDNDLVIGPSDNDLGSWTKFHYTKVENYNWRTPVGHETANFNPGLLADYTDDRGSYVYGSKDVCYLEKIESKNYVAIFVLEDRLDGLGVIDQNGAIDAIKKLKCLKKIMLYSKKEYNESLISGAEVVPIKTVHFEYDYELCPGIENRVAGEVGQGVGKLTLKKIYFTYKNSNKAKFSSYEFSYTDDESGNPPSSEENPAYNLKAYDRWGNYKPNLATLENTVLSPDPTNAENPYTPQNKALADQYSRAWTLRKIKLPSGGGIKIEYEADDYTHVQNKQAMEMLEIVGTNYPNPHIATQVDDPLIISKSGENDAIPNTKFYFNLKSDENGNKITEISKYFVNNYNVFIKGLCVFNESEGAGLGNGDKYYEYVTGYYELDTNNESPAYGIETVGSQQYGYFRLKPVKIKDNSQDEIYNPLTRTALQFIRLNHSRKFFNHSDPGGSNFKQIVVAIGEAFGTFKELFKNTNHILYDKDQGTRIIPFKSQVRVNNVSGRKFGGGSRVKKIEMYDNWAEMSSLAGGHNGISMSYGQEYFYRTEEGGSSGIASYEPQIGGEENPWKQPVYYDINRKAVPDDRFFKEEPIGESFFPAPSVGYSRVEVQNLSHVDVSMNATGKVVYEFYTAKEFPTIARRNKLDIIRDKPSHISSLLNFTSKDHLIASQGFYVELNDMHGKPKSQKVYSESQDSPISSVEYEYKADPLGDGTFRLRNDVKSIKPTGEVVDATVGVHMEILNDFVEESGDTWGANLSGNIDMIVLPFIPFAVPSVWPNWNRDKSLFRSSATTKVVQRFGILENTIAKEDGSQVSTRNLAYDSESGEVLLTETNTNFEDKLYNLNIPAYWRYKEMGPAYQNIGFSISMGFDASGEFNFYNANKYFVIGDELALTGGYQSNGVPISPVRGWVVEVNSNNIKVIDQSGNPIVGSNFTGKIVRSGYRNMQMGAMASITTRVNPIEHIEENIYSSVLQATAIEYTNNWRTACDCLAPNGEWTTTNPFVLGILGVWKPSKSYLYLSERSQSDINDNTDLRYDGFFKSFNPFYYLNDSHEWMIDYRNWTYSSEITEFSPYGMELETQDALGRYSAARFGYHQSLPTAVAANSSYNQMAFESFEYISIATCGDNDFDSNFAMSNIINSDAHSGNYSLRVDNSSVTRLQNFASYPPTELPCSLGIEITQESTSNTTEISVTGGLPGYSIMWDVSIGTPIISLTSENQLTVSGSNWQLTLHILDAQGNNLSQVLSSNNN